MPLHKELRRLWIEKGYSKRMGSAEVVKPPSDEWIRVYHITPAEFGMSDLALRRIKVARFLDLNDPFELLAVNLRNATKPIKKRLSELKTTYNSSTGLLCFSANWTNPVLWSHYGNKHRGICLGFDLRRGIHQKVSYNEDRLIAKLTDKTPITDKLKQQLLSTKFSHWRYEEELRVFVPLADKSKVRAEANNLRFYPFNDDLVLREVILGRQCSVPLDAVRKLVDATFRNVTTIKARLAVGSFSVVPTEKTVP